MELDTIIKHILTTVQAVKQHGESGYGKGCGPSLIFGILFPCHRRIECWCSRSGLTEYLLGESTDLPKYGALRTQKGSQPSDTKNIRKIPPPIHRFEYQAKIAKNVYI